MRLPLQVILEELNARTKHSLIPTVVKALRKAKSISNTVAIVTNARSARWLSVFESMFPEVVALLQEEGIPLIRSCPEGSEPNISRSTEYFFYWMNAKVCPGSCSETSSASQLAESL